MSQRTLTWATAAIAATQMCVIAVLVLDRPGRQEDKISPRIVAQEFVLQDARGRERVRLSVEEDMSVVVLLDEHGKETIRLAGAKDGSSLQMVGNAHSFARLEVHGDERELVLGSTNSSLASLSFAAGRPHSMPAVLTFGAPGGATPLTLGLYKGEGDLLTPHVFFRDEGATTDLTVFDRSLVLRGHDNDGAGWTRLRIGLDGTVNSVID